MSLKRLCLNFIILAYFAACCTIDIGARRMSPRYKGVDPELTNYVNDYTSLAKQSGIVFTHKVTIGFTDIKDDYIIGLTNYGLGFREIDIDRQYWKGSSTMTRRILMYHELSHAYCYREHDFGEDRPYGEAKENRKNNHKGEGFFKDGCPISIMYPIIIEDDCSLAPTR